MALKDCLKILRKEGYKVELTDRRLLKQYMDEGMSDANAVRRLMVEAGREILSVTERVQAVADVDVETTQGQLSLVRDERREALKERMGRRKKVVDKINQLDADYWNMSGDAAMFDEVMSQGLGFNVQFAALTEGEAKMYFGQLMMKATITELPTGQPGQNKDRVWPEDRFRRAMETNVLDVKGVTPDQIYDSRVKLEERMAANRAEKQTLDAERAAVQEEIDRSIGPDVQRELFQGRAEVNQMGLFSALEQATIDMNLPEWKADNPATGKSIWAKLKKMPGIKQEEIYWTGIEEFLNSATEKLTREQVQQFIRANGVDVDEIVTDPDHAGTEDLSFDSGQIWDEPEAWEHQVEDLMYEFNNDYPPSGVEDPSYWFDVDSWFGQKEDEIASDYGFDEEQMERLDGTGNTLADVAADMGYDIYADYESDVTDAAQEAAEVYAEESYMQDPLMIYRAETDDTDIYIFGNDNYGYTISEGSYGNNGQIINTGEIWSYGEAEVQAEEHARDSGYLTAEDDPNAPRWESHVEGMYDEYREVKITLPYNPGESFYQTAHFDDENIVMFLRVTDRRLKNREGEVTPAYQIDEAQSDWHQQGREYGYINEQRRRELRDRKSDLRNTRLELADQIKELWAQEQDIDPDSEIYNRLHNALVADTVDSVLRGKSASDFRTEMQDFVNFVIDNSIMQAPEPMQKFIDAGNELDDVNRQLQQDTDRVADAPFKGDNWLNLGLKRAIVQAVEAGKSQLTWATGEQVVSRWGERYRNFYEMQYDKKMPSMVKKLTGQEAVKNQDAGIEYWTVDLTPELVERVASEGFSMFQDERGRITFNEARKGFIEILSSGDYSTFIHETGHLYFEVMRWAAQQPNAPESLRADWETLKRHTGATDQYISVEAHEKFANMYEVYHLEGKAPALALQDAFNAFRAWMLRIYAKIKNLGGVHLNPEIRGVMDRMLATEEEIALAEQSQGYVAMIATLEDASELGMNEEQFNLYARQIQREHDDAVEKEHRRLMEVMRREEETWWKDERAKVREEVEAEAHEMRVYRALSFLQRGQEPNGDPARRLPFKITKASLEELLAGDQQTINALPRPFIYTVKEDANAVHVDIAARELGYSDAQTMITEILNAPKMEAFIEGETTVRMEQRYPDPFNDGTIAERALRRVHSEGRLAILGKELRALRKKMNEDRAAVGAARRGDKRQDREARDANKSQLPSRAELKMIKAGIKSVMNKQMVRDIKPHVYLRAEQKAGRAAFAAMETRNYAEAYRQKLIQIKNHEMYREAIRINKEMQSTHNFLKRFTGPRKRRQLGKLGVLDQIDAVLEGIDLKQRSLAEVDRAKAFKELREAAAMGKVVVEQEILAKVVDDNVNWQEFTPDDLRGMRDLIKQIEHGAVNEDKMMVNDELVDFQEVVNDVEESLLENNKTIKLRPGGGLSTGERFNKNVDQGVMTWLRPSSIARVLDGAGFGAITRRIIVPMRRAYSEKLIPMLHQAQSDVAKIYNSVYTAKELGQMSKRRFHIPALDATYSKSELLTMALYMGSQSGQDAVYGGTYDGKQVFSPQTVKQMLAHLTTKDWQFVQKIWDYNETYKDALFDAEERRRGIRPETVEPKAFEQRTADGDVIIVKGGYMRLRYDKSMDAERGKKKSKARSEEEITQALQHVAGGTFVTANTRAGATYNRVKNHGRVVRLGLNAVDSNLREIVRDIAIGDEVMHIKRLLEDPAVERSFLDTNNEGAYEALNLWLTDAAVGELPAEGVGEFVTAWIRTGFVKAKLGWNFSVMFLQFTGLFQTMAVIGSAQTAKGLGRFMRNPRAAMQTVFEQSQFLTTRYSVGAFDKDVQDTSLLVKAEYGELPTRFKRTINWVGYTLFAGIAQCQKYVDVITWLGAYEKGLNEVNGGLPESEAIIYADSQVEAAQTSGFFSDRSGFERGTTGLRKNRQSQFIRIWTTLISYMLAKSNIAYEKTKDTNFKDPKQLMGWMFDMMLLFVVEGVASAVLYNRLPEEDDEPEDWAKWTAVQTAESMAAGVPFLRELAAARYGGGNTAIGVLSNDSMRMLEQIGQGEVDFAQVDAILDTVGTVAHLPTGQISKTLKTVMTEDDPEWYEYFTGPRN